MGRVKRDGLPARALALLTCLAVVAIAAPAEAALKRPWPPIPKTGSLFVHFGEEHWSDDDGLRIFPKVIHESARYSPDLVTASGDKSNDGTVENLERWKELMGVFDDQGIPYFAGVGNHDRKTRPGFPDGIDPMGELANYMDVFAERPFPFGDAAPYAVPGLEPTGRPASDPVGASSHYAVEFGPVRWIFIDNSCFGIINCDGLQNPSFPDAEGNQDQYDFLASEAAKADAEGDLVFVVMHMPTQDDRPGHTAPTPGPHTMGEGSSPDNQLFEQEAAAAGVDGVFVGHIKGMWQYRAQGIPYFTDGGAGGEVYVGSGESGVDSGYWHGFRLVHIARDGTMRTDAVPVFEPRGIEIDGPKSVEVGERVTFTAIGQQPTEEGPDVKLQLRAPDDSVSNASKLPEPAHIWNTRRPLILAPVASDGDDPRRNAKRQTTSGRFEALCPGKVTIRIKSGWATAQFPLRVTGDGPKSCD